VSVHRTIVLGNNVFGRYRSYKMYFMPSMYSMEQNRKLFKKINN